MTTPAVPIVFGGLMAWMMYRRIRRNIGRQPLRPVRLILSVAFLSLVTALILVFSLQVPKMLFGIAGGLLLGCGLGYWGLRLTKFETTEAGHFYTPNTQIGIALSLLLVGRILYRLWMLRQVTDMAHQQPQLLYSPLTFFIFGLVAGYYLFYRAGLFWHTRDKR